MSAHRERPEGEGEISFPPGRLAALGRRLDRIAIVVAAGTVAAFVAAAVALATWSLPAAGSAGAAAGTFTPPAAVSASGVPGSGLVSVGWAGIPAPDGGAVDGYVVERLQGATVVPACGSSAASPLPATPTACLDAVAVAGAYTYRVRAVFRTWTATSPASGAVDVVLDITPPTVTAISRSAPSPTATSPVAWEVAFSEPVSGLDVADFALVQAGGLSGATITGVTGSGPLYTVSATSGGPAGTLRLDLVDDDTVVDAAANALGGTGAGNGSLAGQAYTIDTTPPSTPSLTLSGASGATFVTASTAYLSAQAGRSGGFTVTAVTADADTGIAGVAFPVLAGLGSGGGTDTSAPYATTYGWSGAVGASGLQPVTATNGTGLTGTASFSVVQDTAAPTGGSLTVDGGATTTAAATVAVATTPFAEAQSATASGLATNVVTRSASPLAGNTCGTFGAPAVVGANGPDTGLATGCYRYTLTGTDNVGNSATVSQTIKVDLSAPSTPVLTVTGVTGNAFAAGTTVYANGQAGFSGSFAIAATSFDVDSGILDVGFAAPTGFATGGGLDVSSPYASTYSWSGAFAASGSQAVTARNGVLSTAAAAFTLVSDTAAPTGGALTVNAGATYNTTGSVAIASTAYAEAQSATQSGLASSLVTRASAPLVGNACGTYGAPLAVPGNGTDTGLATGCHLYTLQGTDRVGNTATLTRTVMVDTTAPSLPALALSAATGNTFLNGTVAFINAQAGRSGSFTVGATTTDPDTGILDVTFPALTGFTSGGGGDTTMPFSTTYAWSGAVTGTGVRSVTARNPALLSASGTFSVVSDTTAPTGGSLTVNGVAASTGTGSTSTSATGSYAVATSDYGETASATASGLLASTVTRAQAPVTSGTCGTYGPEAPFAGTAEAGLGVGCFRYTQTGADQVGNTAARVTRVLSAPVRITSIVGAGSGVTISGTGLWGGGAATVVVCTANTAPTCRRSVRVYRNTAVAVGTAYTWTVTTTAITGATTYYAWVTQGTTTGSVVTFPPLPSTAP